MIPLDLSFGGTWPQRVRPECRRGGTRRARESHDSMTGTKYVEREARKEKAASVQVYHAAQKVQLQRDCKSKGPGRE